MARHSTWSERLKWAEEHGLNNLQEKFTTGDNVNKEAQTTLTYVLTGMGGTFAYLLQAIDKPVSGAIVGALALCAYFTALGAYLVAKTFFLGAFPSPFQEPSKLLQREDLPIDEVREGELANIDDRLAEAQRWIRKKAFVVNVIRGFLVASPVFFIVVVSLYKLAT